MPEIICTHCDEPIEAGATYYDINRGEEILCQDCYEELDGWDVVHMLGLTASELLEEFASVDRKQLPDDDRPKPEPPVPGQLSMLTEEEVAGC